MTGMKMFASRGAICREAYKLFSSQSHIQLMVKPLYSLALRALTVNQQMAAQLTRIQSGFLPGKQLEEAQATAKLMQEMLCEMQKALNAPAPLHSPAKNFVPLK